MASACRASLPGVEVITMPMSDGGPGLVDVLVASRRGFAVEAPCVDPLMRPTRAEFGILPGDVAVIEMAAASGLVLLLPTERDPLVATTRGTGDLIRAALDEGVSEIILGVGGSATVDGGAGAVQALGVRLLDADGVELAPGGGPLAYLDRVDASGIDPRLTTSRLRIACDVKNPLTGPEGAAPVFGPQKGASSDDVAVLEAALAHFAAVLHRETGVDVAAMPGSGAAGGLPAALVALVGATIEPGFDLVAGVVGLESAVAESDVVITGEGRLDGQTRYGKTAAGVARLARQQGKPVGAVVGHVDGSYGLTDEFDATEQLVDDNTPVEAAMRDAEHLLHLATLRLLRTLVPGG